MLPYEKPRVQGKIPEDSGVSFGSFKTNFRFLKQADLKNHNSSFFPHPLCGLSLPAQQTKAKAQPCESTLHESKLRESTLTEYQP